MKHSVPPLHQPVGHSSYSFVVVAADMRSLLSIAVIVLAISSVLCDRRCDPYTEWGECDSPCGTEGSQERSQTCNDYGPDGLIEESVTSIEFQQCNVECTTTSTTTTTTTTTPKPTTTTTTTTPKPTTTTTKKPTTTTKKPCTHKPKPTKKPCTHKPKPTTTPRPTTGGKCEQHCHHKKRYSCFKDVSNCHKYTICERVDVYHYKYYWKQYCGHCGKKYWSQSRQKCTTRKPSGCYSGKAETWRGSSHYGKWPSRYGKLNSRFTRRSPYFHM